MTKYNVYDTVKETVVRVEKIDPAVHFHHSNRPFTKGELETIDVVSKKEAK